ncbi:hypothetical protein D3C87_339630 [compost metagenome]
MAVLFLLLSSLLGMAATTSQPQDYYVTAQMGLMETTGNSDSKTYDARLTTGYNFATVTLMASGDYINTMASGEDISYFWQGQLRFEKEFLNEENRFFLSHKTEGEPFMGYIQRDSDDIGWQRLFMKSDTSLWLGEISFRYSKTQPQGPTVTVFEDSIRFYTSYEMTWASAWSAKGILEYIPQVSNDEYLLNAEAILERRLSSLLSLNLTYLLHYQSLPYNNVIESTATYTLFNMSAKF